MSIVLGNIQIILSVIQPTRQLLQCSVAGSLQRGTYGIGLIIMRQRANALQFIHDDEECAAGDAE